MFIQLTRNDARIYLRVSTIECVVSTNCGCRVMVNDGYYDVIETFDEVIRLIISARRFLDSKKYY